MPSRHAFPSSAFQTALLRWYDKHQRILPWRARPGQKPNPYHVWLSEIMLQQTVVATVIPYFETFISLWPSIQDLARAKPEDVMREWAGLGYYARARNLILCAQQIMNDHGGKFPTTEPDLLALRGIGPYTAAAISAIAFNQHAVVVDGNIERVTARLFRVQKKLPEAKPTLRQNAAIIFDDVRRCGDFAQALMDLGATICTPQSPKCNVCPVAKFCEGHAKGDAAQYPLKKEKTKIPTRVGKVFWITSGDKVLCEVRDEARMLGGMMGLPTTDWDLKSDAMPAYLKRIKTHNTGVEIEHVFSHFRLKLSIHTASLKSIPKKHMKFILIRDSLDSGFPSLFQKVVKKMVQK
jgi:A/G-specific adenine glycosylase